MKNLDKIHIKKQKGITLIALVITIIVLLILAGITINMSARGTQESEEDVLLSELGMIQNAILQRKTKADLTGESYPGETITKAGIKLDDVIANINANKASEEDTITRKDTNDGHYYVLTNSNNGFRDLEIKSAKDEYIVNYETGEVINYTTNVTESGKPLYIYARELN